MKVPNGAPGEREADAERRVHDADAGHVAGRERHGARGASTSSPRAPKSDTVIGMSG